VSVDGLSFRWRDEGTIAGIAVALTAGNPVPALPYAQTTGLLAVTVAAAATVTLWQASASPLLAFDFCFVLAGDYPTVDGLADDGTTLALAGLLELTCNNGDAAEQIWVEQLRAACPYRRFSNIGYYGNTGVSGTADVIDLLRYKNDTAADLTVRYLLAAS
jgi:hypothetical protein